MQAIRTEPRDFRGLVLFVQIACQSEKSRCLERLHEVNGGAVGSTDSMVMIGKLSEGEKRVKDRDGGNPKRWQLSQSVQLLQKSRRR